MARKSYLITVFLILVTTSLAFPATKYVGIDDKTGGAWEQKYGEDGYIFCNTNGPQGTVVDGADAVTKNDVAKLPNYVEKYTLGGGIQGYVWQIADK